MALGALISIAFAGLAVADLTITVGEMATEGSFIRPETNDRRQVLEETFAEAQRLDQQMKDGISALTELSIRVQNSYDNNQQIMANLANQFARIADFYTEREESGIFIGIEDGTIPPADIDTLTFQVMEYLSGVFFMGSAGSQIGQVVEWSRSGTNYFTKIQPLKDDLRLLKNLKLKGIRVDPNTGTVRTIPRSEVRARFLNDKSFAKMKRPVTTARFRLMKAYFLNPTMSAISVVSIVTQTLAANQRLDEINAQIHGLNEFINALSGAELGDDSHLEDVDLENQNVIDSLPELVGFTENMEIFRDWDFEQFQEMVRFFDVTFGEHREDIELLLEDPNVLGPDQSFFAEMMAELYQPGLRHPDADPPCRESIADADDYTLEDMRCVQVPFRNFITQEGLELIAAFIVGQTNELLEADRESVESFCTNPVFAGLPADVLYCTLKDFNVPDFAIDIVVGDESNGICNGHEFYNRNDAGEPTTLLFSEADCG